MAIGETALRQKRINRLLAVVIQTFASSEFKNSVVIMKIHSLLFSLAVLPVVLSSSARGDDWPQWRGLHRDGTWRESGIVDSIPDAGLPVVWRARVLNGWSGPAVAGGRVFVTDHNYKSDPEVERIVCFDEGTGERLWIHEYPCPYGNMEYGNGPRATPIVHEGRVYALGTMGHLHCLNVESGAVIWKKDPAVDLQVAMPRYGVSASPLIEGNAVIISPGARPNGTAIAFDRKTGTELWRVLGDRTAYSSPIALTMAGTRQVILWTGDNVNSLDPLTGQLLWQVPYKASFDPAQATASPVFHDGKLLCLAAWNRGSMMLDLDAQRPGASVLWKTRTNPTGSTGTPIFQQEKYIYAVVGDGALCCLDAANGDEIWRTTAATSHRFGMAHLITNGDTYFLLNQQGQLIAARLTSEGYTERGRTLLIEPTAGYRAAGPVCWAHPAFANGKVIARNDRELICASLTGKSALSIDAAETISIQSVNLAGADGNDVHQTLAVAVSPDGKVASLGTGWGMVKQVELATGSPIPSVKQHQDWVCALTYSSDGKYLVSAGGSEFSPERNGGKTSGEVKVWDRQTNEQRGSLEGHTSKVFAAVFSPDGKSIATGSADQTVRLWNVDPLQETRVLRGHRDAISALAWSADGKVLASASWDKTVKLWDASSGELVSTLTASEEEVMSVALSPDGRQLATGGTDWIVRFWNLPSLKLTAQVPGHHGTVYAVAFSPDGKTLASASGDETIRLWNPDSHRLTHVLRGHRSGVTSIAFTPDNTRLISGSLNDSVRIWNLQAKPAQ